MHWILKIYWISAWKQFVLFEHCVKGYVTIHKSSLEPMAWSGTPRPRDGREQLWRVLFTLVFLLYYMQLGKYWSKDSAASIGIKPPACGRCLERCTQGEEYSQKPVSCAVYCHYYSFCLIFIKFLLSKSFIALFIVFYVLSFSLAHANCIYGSYCWTDVQ